MSSPGKVSFSCDCGEKQFKCSSDLAGARVSCPVPGCGRSTIVPGTPQSAVTALHAPYPQSEYIPASATTATPQAAFQAQASHVQEPSSSNVLPAGGLLGRAKRPGFDAVIYQGLVLAVALGGVAGWLARGHFTRPEVVIQERVVRVPVETARETVVKKAKPRPVVAAPVEDSGLAILDLLPPESDGPPKLEHRVGLMRPMDANQAAVKTVVFSEDGHKAFSRDVRGEHQRGVVAFDLASGKVLWGNYAYGTGPTLISSPDSASVAFGSWSNLFLFDAAKGSQRSGFKLGPGKGDGWASSLRWFPDGSRLAVGHDGGGVSIFEVAVKGTPLTIETNGAATALDVTRDGRHLLIGTGGRVVRVHDLSNKGAWEREYKGHPQPIVLIRLSPFGNYVASISAGANQSASLHIWEYRSCERVYSALIGSDVACLDLSRDWRHIVYGGNDGKLHIYSVVEKKELEYDGTGHTGAIRSVAISPDGYHCLSGGADTTVRLWGLPKVFKNQVASLVVNEQPDSNPGSSNAAVAPPQTASTAAPIVDPDADAKKFLDYARQNMKSSEATYAAENFINKAVKATKNPDLLAEAKKLRAEIAEIRRTRP